MKPLRQFELLEPKSLKEATFMLNKWRGTAIILAGGTDTMSCWSGRTYHTACYSKGTEPAVLRCFSTGHHKPRALINIKGIRGLKGIKKNGKTLRVGALTTLNELMESSMLTNGLIILKDILARIGCVETRNMATVGGNLLTHAPAAGLAPILLCLEAKGVVSDGERKREIPLEHLFGSFKRPGAVPRLPGSQILVQLIIPDLESGFGVGYEKTTEMASPMSNPIASAAAMLKINAKGKVIEKSRVYIGSCTFYPYRCEKAEELLTGKVFEKRLIAEAAEMDLDRLKPISDNHGSAGYRVRVAGSMVRRALEQASQMALNNLGA